MLKMHIEVKWKAKQFVSKNWNLFLGLWPKHVSWKQLGVSLSGSLMFNTQAENYTNNLHPFSPSFTLFFFLS